MEETIRLKQNTMTSLVNRVVILISGLILPRLILQYYGADTHGLTSSIAQFLTIITFLDLGVGSVVQSALYRPLAKADNDKISAVLTSAKHYFRKISYVLVAYVMFLVFFFPLAIDPSLPFLSTAFLVLAMSISSFSQYYFGIINELFLNADERAYIQLSMETILVLVNLGISVILILSGFTIQIVKLSTGLIYLIHPLYLNYYVNKYYDVRDDVELEEEPMKQKWNGMAQHIAYSVTISTDIVILSLFSTLENVSIYAIYNMVVTGVQLVISSLTNNFTAFFGTLLANDEYNLLKDYFAKIEWLVHALVIYLFGMTAVLIVPFVSLYTTGVVGVNYHVPIFSLILVLSYTVNSIRTPYHSIILSANHYKQTQWHSVIEAVINVVVSMVMVDRFGLIGVAVGSLLAMSYRTVYLVWYLSRTILYRSIKYFVKQFMVDLLVFSLMLLFGYFVDTTPESIMEWVYAAILYGGIFSVISFGMNYLFYREYTEFYMQKIFRRWRTR